MKTEYIVISSAAKMPTSCWGRYRRAALVEVEEGVIPKMISMRARGVVRIVEVHEKLHAGETDRSAFGKAMFALQAKADRLNSDELHRVVHEIERKAVA
jgi:hypothetical protein